MARRAVGVYTKGKGRKRTVHPVTPRKNSIRKVRIPTNLTISDEERRARNKKKIQLTADSYNNVKRINDARSKRARAVDDRTRASETFGEWDMDNWPTWASNPGRYDIEGFDAYENSKYRPRGPKHLKPNPELDRVLFDRLHGKVIVENGKKVGVTTNDKTIAILHKDAPKMLRETSTWEVSEGWSNKIRQTPTGQLILDRDKLLRFIEKVQRVQAKPYRYRSDKEGVIVVSPDDVSTWIGGTRKELRGKTINPQDTGVASYDMEKLRRILVWYPLSAKKIDLRFSNNGLLIIHGRGGPEVVLAPMS